MGRISRPKHSLRNMRIPMISSCYSDDLQRAYLPTENILSERLQMLVLSLNHMPKEQVVEQVVGSPAFAVSRSQGHQSHWSAFEPLSGTSVYTQQFICRSQWIGSRVREEV